MVKVTILEARRFDSEFGKLGQEVGRRTGPNKRTQDQKEWYVVRRFLKCAIDHGRIALPMSFQKATPPLPDFVMKRDGSVVAFIEILKRRRLRTNAK